MEHEQEEDEYLKGVYEKRKVFEDLRHDFKNAKEAKTTIDQLMSEWNDAYESLNLKSLKNRSKYKSMEIAKQVEKIKVNITEPFTNSSHPIRVTTGKYEKRARIIQKYLNSEFTSEFNRVDFMDRYADVLCREGTVWVKTAWNYDESNKKEVLENATIEEIMSRDYDPDVLKQKDNGKFYAEYNKIVVKKNNPDAIICRNEHIYPDPSARSKDELRFMCYERETTISDMKASGKYSDKVLDKIKGAKDTKEDSGHGVTRNSKAESYGYKIGYDTLDKPRNKVTIIEYYGYYDLNGDGIAEPIFASWVKNEDINLILEENGMPNNPIPFFSEVFSAVTFSLWGNPLAYFIDDNQKIKTGIMRGIMDNMSLANNGQKFIKNGTLDYLNFKRLTNGEKYIMTQKDPNEGIRDGAFNNLPSSTFAVYELISKETEELAGNNGNGIGLKGKSETDSPVQLTLSQQMQLGLVIKTSNLLSNIFKDWLLMSESFLENEQIEALFTESEMPDLFVFKNNYNVKLSFKVATNAQRQMRLQQINMLMQQSKMLGETIPQEQLRELVAEMYELFDMYEKAEAIRTYVPQLSEEQIAMQQLGIENAMLENAKLKAEILEIESRTKANGANAQKSVLDGIAGYQYKQAQSAEKYGKAESHKVNNALMPSTALAEIQSMLNTIKGN